MGTEVCVGGEDSSFYKVRLTATQITGEILPQRHWPRELWWRGHQSPSHSFLKTP